MNRRFCISALLSVSTSVSFLGAFGKYRKVTLSLVMSVLTHGTAQHPLEDFDEILYLSLFDNLSGKFH